MILPLVAHNFRFTAKLCYPPGLKLKFKREIAARTYALRILSPPTVARKNRENKLS